MLDILAITGPIFLCIALGYLTTRGGLFDRGDMRVFGKFLINLALPALLFNALSQRSVGEIFNGPYLAAYALGGLIMLAGTVLWYRKVAHEGMARSAIMAMGMTCPNSGYVGYPVMLLTLGAPVAGVALALNMVVENLLIIPILLALADMERHEAGHWRQLVMQTLQGLARNPLILQQPIGRGSQTAPNAEVWLATVVEQSEKFLFERKCRYCHEYEGMDGGYPVVKLVNEVRGQYEPQQRQGKPWLDHAAFSHRAHRAVECLSCHRDAAASKLTSDVLIAKMPGCLPCHGSTGTRQDRCSTCHLYHDKSQESDRDRRPIEELIGVLHRDNSAGGS